jgi:hypothetical protein
MRCVLIILLLCACKGNTGGVGASGSVGEQGTAGNPGLNGINAQPCTVVPITNGAEIVCPDGTSQTVTDGVPGTNGQNGLDGTDATPVTWVQFCAGTTPSYPSVFPEGGLCIDGNIYAVYSANGGFLTLVPPGEYSSDGVGSSCDFTILASCQIQN